MSSNPPNPGVESILPGPQSTLSCLGGHLHIQGDSEPSPVVLGEQATMERTTRRFHAIASTLAQLNAEGLSEQTGQRPPHHVELCSGTRS